MLRCLLLLCLAASSNPKPPGVAAPKPPPEVQQLRFFEGEWRCTGKVLDITVQTRWAFKPEANHFWLGVRNAEQKSKSHPLTREAQGYWGYDAVGRQFVRVMMFSQGDWEQATSPGWTGEEWLWTGELNQADGHKLPLRHSITSRGSREFTDKLELNVDGEWRVAATSTVCKK